MLRFAAGEIGAQGLYHFGARFYDPALGRWTQRDPLNLITGLRNANRYVYAGGDPVSFVDREGLHPVYAIVYGGVVIGRVVVKAADDAATGTARGTSTTVRSGSTASPHNSSRESNSQEGDRDRLRSSSRLLRRVTTSRDETRHKRKHGDLVASLVAGARLLASRRTQEECRVASRWGKAIS